ncbi:hypothetical protein CCU68_34360 [Pseudomonas gingeri NCPPB 3146 = LMG 5327]|uniref:Uncharacterized protein n=2 Tax=Pseudomonas gingeri TaxID=117681 RepID=A0A7Y7Y2A1_9PSED|nr:hypothetical protein [Pseudomonas gingeri]NWC16575.1 hypothetical protein [Pseudomonas gingeri]PNQ87915.1 hypothetical protein CCU68_34360 [Pseudomonas gingeri NCPPB 3146 = LMG 5327]
MVALRYSISNTSQNLNTLCELIRDQNCHRVILFGTVENELDSENRDSNLPYVAALAVYEIPNIDSIYVLFDGIFLTAARYPRYTEVRALLDVAQESGRVYFCEARAPLTRTFTSEDAVAALKDLGPIRRLDADSRADYFALLSGFTEQQYVDIYNS